MDKTTFYADFLGLRFTRTSDCREYSHVILGRTDDGEWVSYSWAASEKLARARVSQAQQYLTHVSIVPCAPLPKGEPKSTPTCPAGRSWLARGRR